MLVVKEKEVAKLMDQLQAVQDEGQKDSAALEAAEQHFKAVSAGLSTNEDGEEATLAGQMMSCKNDMSKADTEAKQVRKGPESGTVKLSFKWIFKMQVLNTEPFLLNFHSYKYELFNVEGMQTRFDLMSSPPTLCGQAQMTLKHAQAELKTKQAEMKKMDSGYKKDQDSLQAVKSSREKLQAELAKLNYEGTVCL